MKADFGNTFLVRLVKMIGETILPYCLGFFLSRFGLAQEAKYH